MNGEVIMNIIKPSTDWYRKIWTLDIKNQLWVEKTNEQVDFIIESLNLTGSETILDLACGYGRHSLELARRGYHVTGIDITEEYISDAIEKASNESLSVEFHHMDIRDLLNTDELHNKFDVVLNLADGAIGYLEDDSENLKIFRVISKCLRKGGRSLIDIVSKEHAQMHFPKRSWKVGNSSISLASFDFDEKTNRMTYCGFSFQFGEVVKLPKNSVANGYTRLYNYDEVNKIFKELHIEIKHTYGDYDINIKSSHRSIQLLLVSKKI